MKRIQFSGLLAKMAMYLLQSLIISLSSTSFILAGMGVMIRSLEIVIFHNKKSAS
ncbi:hypothetical protein PSI23_14510 [Xenorhabdus sp. XENO-10]|uniref:Uncharacterized protein n=1 Tax=Xenorhabdus yunnanensis TaxID=3025878 RepID=A0ABT5LHQ2_9GAMM|nr:hypothetical protein [Xenorhabdus yunnanensis]MDC9590469.1 hypothetical protein [Xenorhabdus yunnanensis]